MNGIMNSRLLNGGANLSLHSDTDTGKSESPPLGSLSRPTKAGFPSAPLRAVPPEAPIDWVEAASTGSLGTAPTPEAEAKRSRNSRAGMVDWFIFIIIKFKYLYQ